MGLKGACVLGRLAGNPVEGDEVEPVVVDDVVPSLGLRGLSGFKGPEEFPELPDELPELPPLAVLHILTKESNACQDFLSL